MTEAIKFAMTSEFSTNSQCWTNLILVDFLIHKFVLKDFKIIFIIVVSCLEMETILSYAFCFLLLRNLSAVCRITR